MYTPFCLRSPYEAPDTASLNSILAELWRLEALQNVGDVHTCLGWVRCSRTCTLNNTTPSQSSVALILRGHKVLLCGNERLHTVTAGGLAFFPAGQPASLMNEPDEEGEYLALTLAFDAQVLERVRQRFGAASDKEKRSSPSQQRTYTQLLESIVNFLCFLPDAENYILARMQLEQIVYLLWRLDFPVFATQPPVVQRIRALVEASPAHLWSVCELAFALHTSERTLRRQLKTLGTSPAELVRLSRLQCGLDMLMHSHLRVGEVATRCGYASQSRFAELFREQFGVLPKTVMMATRCQPHYKLLNVENT